MSAPRYRDEWPKYARQWDSAVLLRHDMANDAAERILANKARYQAVEAKTGVPWWWIGAVHYRESDFDFNTQLAQGDPLNRVSTNVPRGQGPYYGPDAWDRAAIIALEDHNLTKVIDWRIEKAIYWAESYNGWGYHNHGVPSAYVWAGTDVQRPGMYVRDGVWSETAQDRRVGTAAIWRALVAMGAFVPARETPDFVPPMPQPQPFPKPEPKPMPTPTPSPNVNIDIDTLAKVVMDMAKELNKQKQTPAFQAVYKALIAWLPNLGLWGSVAAVVLNAFGVLGAAPMAGAENATAVTTFATLFGALVNNFLPKEPAK